jgi:hypothetical protein
MLAASTSFLSYPILSDPILSYAAVPPGLTVSLCRSSVMKAKTESVLWEKPHGRERRVVEVEVVCGTDWA